MSGIVNSTGERSGVLGAGGVTALTWCTFNGTGTIAITDSLNASSLTDVGTGEYKVNFTKPMPDATYPFSIAGRYASWYTCYCSVAAPTTTYLHIGASDAHPVNVGTGGGWVDVSYISLTIFGE